MNFLDLMKSMLFGQGGAADRDTQRPGWRHPVYRMKKARTPFAGREKRIAGSRFTIEEFLDKDLRNQRFAELREQGTPHVYKFSTVKDRKSLWCISRP